LCLLTKIMSENLIIQLFSEAQKNPFLCFGNYSTKQNK